MPSSLGITNRRRRTSSSSATYLINKHQTPNTDPRAPYTQAGPSLSVKDRAAPRLCRASARCTALHKYNDRPRAVCRSSSSCLVSAGRPQRRGRSGGATRSSMRESVSSPPHEGREPRGTDWRLGLDGKDRVPTSSSSKPTIAGLVGTTLLGRGLRTPSSGSRGALHQEPS